MQYIIELAEPSDLREILAVRRSAILQDAPSFMPDADVERWADKPKSRAVKIQINAGELWVARAERGLVVAWVRINGVNIDGLYVCGDYLRMGIGSAMLAFAEQQMQQLGICTAYLESSVNATAFYLKYGYVPSGKSKLAHAVNMQKTLAV